MLKIATWNVNSLRVRLPHMLAWLKDVQPDVLALQETKLQNADFPYTLIEEVGYNVISSGQKTYNGVAILAREKMQDVVTDFLTFDDPQRRMLAVTIGDIRILDVYVPNGESVTSDKYKYKLNWLRALTMFLKEQVKNHPKTIVLGDFNIAPAEIDVHNPSAWEGQVLFSDPERMAFQDLLLAGFQDCFRMQSPTEQSFSWWDYRLNAFKRGMGLRIDHILASDALSSQCVRCYIDKAPRAWERPSDHAPVIAEFT